MPGAQWGPRVRYRTITVLMVCCLPIPVILFALMRFHKNSSGYDCDPSMDGGKVLLAAINESGRTESR
jgi:hypothetical protein